MLNGAAEMRQFEDDTRLTEQNKYRTEQVRKGGLPPLVFPTYQIGNERG